MLDGILQKILEDLQEPLLVHAHQRKRLGNRVLQRHAQLVRKRLHRAHRTTQYRAGTLRMKVRRERAAVL
jgi:hypothetical protein